MNTCKNFLNAQAIEILSEELDRRIEDWIDVIKTQYGDNVPDNDDEFDRLNERVHLLLALQANLNTVQIIHDVALCE